MKKALLLSGLMIFAATAAFGQAGTIGVYADLTGANCHVADAIPGLTGWNVVHTNTAGATASQFMIPLPSCNLATFLSDTPVFAVTIGASQTGVAIGYGACLAAPIHILTMNMFTSGITGPCCAITVIPDPNVPSGQIEVVDCGNNLIFGSGFTSYINGNSTCPCTVATEESTWGQVKSLYAE
jgi:hypothetical protein